ncbi:MAG: hypothetical protein COA73_03020 [Candidatus Hydrogenedentota bacterium]|nr:MAG: hypothetical protein COA73_03020 [Candidatus Hydrogenedentota bacterium]
MNNCSYTKDVERWFDGAAIDSDVESHVADCAACAEHLQFLKLTREAIGAVDVRQVIGDAQLPSFLAGIEEGVHTPRKRYTGLWAMASAVAAALIVTVSTMTILSPGPEPVGAQTVVEEYSTEIDGATAESFYTGEEETPTVWVNVPDGDMW